jgi:hypothetical protein
MMNLEVYNVMKKIILVVGVVMLVILLAGSVQAETITATVTDNCRPSPVTFSVPAGQIATNFVLQDLKAGTKCGTGMFIDDYGWTIYSGNVNGPIVYSLSNKVDLSGTRRKSEPYGPLNTLSLGPGTYMAYVDGGKLAYVKVNYELISVNIPSAAESGKVTPPCSNDASLLEPITTKEYAAGPVLEAGTYKIWSGEQNSDGSIAWKAIGPVQLKGKTSYVFDLPNRVLGEFNPLNVKLYPSQAVVTLKCVHEDHYSVCFEKIQSAVASRSQEIHLFSNVPFADSSKFKSNTYQELSIGTTTWDKTPYHLANPYFGTVTVQPGQKCFLAGDSAGQTGWKVDNFLLFEIQTGMETKRLICGAAEPVYYNGERVQQVGSNKFDFNPGEIDLTGYFPQGVPVELKVSALDYGGSGYVSNVYLIIQ